jgi:hypothetical protein
MGGRHDEEAPNMRDNSREETKFVIAVLLFLVGSFSEARAQHGPLPPWKVLADESSAVVVADVVEGNLQVIDPEKKTKVDTGPDGKLSFGDPALYTVGTLARVRMTEIIKNDGKMRQGDIVRVFIYGRCAFDMPCLPLEKEKCVFFLRPLDANSKEFIPAVVQRIDQTAPPGYRAKYDRFDPKGCYTPVEEGYAQVVVPPDKLYFIDKIKQGIAKGP